VASDLIIYPKTSNSEEDYKAKVEVGQASNPSDVAFLVIDEEFPGGAKQFSCVHLNAREALSLACWLMDFAMEHIDLPLIGDFGVQEEAEFDYTASIEQDYAEDEFESEIEEMYCQVCGQTLVNGQCPKDKFLIPAALQQPKHDPAPFEDFCGCYQCRMGS
jgi:hypothetical protein